MAHHTARIGRRRRVLNEEVLTASAMGIAARNRGDLSRQPGDTPRYGAGANIENHPQVTDYVPRRYRGIAAVMLAGLALGACGELVANYADVLSKACGGVTSAELTSALADGTVAWVSAVALLLTACYARLIYSLRRHRVDDSRGRYRVWRLLAGVSVALSANAFVGGHLLVARMLGHLTGWSVLPGSVGWWLAPAGLLGGWLLVKLMLEASECRAAFAAYALCLACFFAAGVAHCWLPEWALPWQDTMSRMLPLAGNILLAVGTLLFARYVVLDVQGLIEHAPSPEPSRGAVVATRRSDGDAAVRFDTAHESKSPAARAERDEQAWTDGSQSEEKDDFENSRPLSKAERKRLRKEQAQRRAA
jgi:hypothetical protein